MSNYRDDVVATAVAKDSVFNKMLYLVEDIAKTSGKVLFTTIAMYSDAAIVSDYTEDKVSYIAYDSAQANDSYVDKKLSTILAIDSFVAKDSDLSNKAISYLVDDSALINDYAFGTTQAYHFDAPQIADSIAGKGYIKRTVSSFAKIKDSVLNQSFKKVNLDDSATVYDESISAVVGFANDYATIVDTNLTKKITGSLSSDKTTITDKTYLINNIQLDSKLLVSEQLTGKLKVFSLIDDSILISDDLLKTQNILDIVSDVIAIEDSLLGKIHARNDIADTAFVDDEIKDSYTTTGYAWTANVDNWAMSRYEGYQFDDLAVINGVMYGMNDSGVHRLDVDSQVEGKIVTGKIDLGNGNLIHPLGAYLEYELSGNSRNLEIGVSTTQSGSKQTYYYLLPTEKSDHLTNGRVLFGRGLRSRHFSFELKMSGEHGYINDLSIDVAATKRRV